MDAELNLLLEESALPESGYIQDSKQMLNSTHRPRTMKEFEQDLSELSKENFNLKLRLYMLEENIDKNLNAENGECLHKIANLTVENESLKRKIEDLQSNNPTPVTNYHSVEECDTLKKKCIEELNKRDLNLKSEKETSLSLQKANLALQKELVTKDSQIQEQQKTIADNTYQIGLLNQKVQRRKLIIGKLCGHIKEAERQKEKQDKKPENNMQSEQAELLKTLNLENSALEETLKTVTKQRDDLKEYILQQLHLIQDMEKEIICVKSIKATENKIIFTHETFDSKLNDLQKELDLSMTNYQVFHCRLAQLACFLETFLKSKENLNEIDTTSEKITYQLINSFQDNLKLFDIKTSQLYEIIDSCHMLKEDVTSNLNDESFSRTAEKDLSSASGNADSILPEQIEEFNAKMFATKELQDKLITKLKQREDTVLEISRERDALKKSNYDFEKQIKLLKFEADKQKELLNKELNIKVNSILEMEQIILQFKKEIKNKDIIISSLEAKLKDLEKNETCNQQIFSYKDKSVLKHKGLSDQTSFNSKDFENESLVGDEDYKQEELAMNIFKTENLTQQNKYKAKMFKEKEKLKNRLKRYEFENKNNTHLVSQRDSLVCSSIETSNDEYSPHTSCFNKKKSDLGHYKSGSPDLGIESDVVSTSHECIADCKSLICVTTPLKTYEFLKRELKECSDIVRDQNLKLQLQCEKNIRQSPAKKLESSPIKEVQHTFQNLDFCLSKAEKLLTKFDIFYHTDLITYKFLVDSKSNKIEKLQNQLKEAKLQIQCEKLRNHSFESAIAYELKKSDQIVRQAKKEIEKCS